MTSGPAGSGGGPGRPGPGRSPRQPGNGSEVPGFREDLAGEAAAVLCLAGRPPPARGAWLLAAAADGNPGCEFTARVLGEAMPSACGGDVLIRVAPDDPPPGRPAPAVLAATLSAHDSASFRVHDSAWLGEHHLIVITAGVVRGRPP